MDWNTPQGILRKGMSIERDGIAFYTQAAERASDKRGKAMFLDLASQEQDHLHLLLAEYRALEAGQDWIPFEAAMATALGTRKVIFLGRRSGLQPIGRETLSLVDLVRTATGVGSAQDHPLRFGGRVA